MRRKSVSSKHTKRKSPYTPRTRESGHPVAPYLEPKRYGAYDQYGDPRLRNTFLVQGLGWKAANVVNVNPNPSFNNNSLDPWQQGLSFKSVVPQNETVFAKNPWFWANGEPRTYFTDEVTDSSVDYELSGQPLPQKSGPMSSRDGYAHNMGSAVDRIFR